MAGGQRLLHVGKGSPFIMGRELVVACWTPDMLMGHGPSIA